MQNFAEKMKEFERIRSEKGQEAFEEAIREYATTMMGGGLQGVVETLQQQIHQEELAYREEAAKRAAQQDEKFEQQPVRKPSLIEGEQSFINVLKESLPSLKSQAQFNAFMASFDALRGLMNAVFSQNAPDTKKYKDLLDETIVAASKISDLTERLKEVPEAATSKLADDFKKAPWQFSEAELQKTLLNELSEIDSLGRLTSWWTSNRQRIDEVRSPALRNPLIDAVRAQKESFTY